jgi:hypothetical protein
MPVIAAVINNQGAWVLLELNNKNGTTKQPVVQAVQCNITPADPSGLSIVIYYQQKVPFMRREEHTFQQALFEGMDTTTPPTSNRCTLHAAPPPPRVQADL